MASKRKFDSGDGVISKRARKVLSLDQIVELLNRLALGESAASVARRYDTNESTVRTIKKSEAIIRASVAGSAPKSAKLTFIPRDSNLEKMENALALWIEDQTQKNVPLSSNIVREKAKNIYNLVKKSAEGSSSFKPTTFQASKGWFENFKKRQSLHNVKIVEVASADHVAAAGYPPELQKLIEMRDFFLLFLYFSFMNFL